MQQVNTVFRLSDKRATAHQEQKRPALEVDLARAFVDAMAALERDDLTVAERIAREFPQREKNLPELQYLFGEIARRRGNLAVAQGHYRRALQAEPQAAYVQHALGNAMQDSGQLEGAIQAYRRALRRTPHLAEAWNDLGTAYFAAGKPQVAVDSYRKALRYAPRHAIALGNLAAALRSIGDVRAARSTYWMELLQRLTRVVRPQKSRRRTLAEESAHWCDRGSTRIASALADAALHGEPQNSSALVTKAILAQRAGQTASQIQYLQMAVKAEPARPDLWLRLANAQRAQGEHAAAVDTLRAAFAGGAADPRIERELAVNLARSGKGAEALAALRTLAPRVNDAETWTAVARVELDQGQVDAGHASAVRALGLEAAYAPALAQLARVRMAQKNWVEALALCEAAIESEPSSVEAHFWYGKALGLVGRWQQAVEALGEAAALDPANVRVILAHATALRAAGQVQEWQRAVKDALARLPRDFDLRAELVVSVFDAGEVERAREMLEVLLAEAPDHVGALAAMSGILNTEGRLDDAKAYARRALEIQPDNVIAHQNLGATLLKNGEYAQGWEHSEWRRRVEEFASVHVRFPFADWTGQDLSGKTLLVYAEQGLGDEIMYASCLPDVIARARQVVVECDPRLGELFRRSFPASSTFGRPRSQTNLWTQSLETQPDYQAPAGSLPLHYRRRREDFPHHDGYLKADPAKVARWRERLSATRAPRMLGISWRGGLVKTGRMRRSLSLDELAGILKTTDTSFVSLQYGSVNDELEAFQRRHGARIAHYQDAIDDYDEGAALICALDGVISVCTAVVHLTGALGRPALVLAPHSPEWRYGMSGSSMAWYPSVRVLRQPEPGDWPRVLAELRHILDSGWGRG